MHSHEQNTEHKSFTKPEEVRKFPNGKAEILMVGGAEVGRLVFEPGWRWSNDVKPLAKTSSCEAPHFQYHVPDDSRSGWTMDGVRRRPRDITSLPEGTMRGSSVTSLVVVDWFGASNYARRLRRPPRRSRFSLMGESRFCACRSRRRQPWQENMSIAGKCRPRAMHDRDIRRQ